MTSRPPNGWPRFLSCGDAALTVELGEGIDRRTSARVVRLHQALREAPPEGVTETLPAFRSLLVQYDPLQTGPAGLQSAITAILASMSEAPLPSRQWLMPVCYAPELALDIAEVATLTGLTPPQVAECHSAETYYVYMLGFLPGFAYMGDVPAPLRLPRRHDPRTHVPQGSVAIATSFAAIYPLASPGGWHVIGRTPATLFDAGRANAALLAPGDLVRFRLVSLDEFDVLSHHPGGGVAEVSAP